MDLTSPWLPTSADQPPAHRGRGSARSTVACVRSLLRCASASELLGAVLTEGPGWVTREGAAIYLLDGSGALRLTVSSGLPDWAHRRYATVDRADDLPVAAALRRRAPVLLSPEQTSQAFPRGPAAGGTGLISVVALPLLVDDQDLGVLALTLAHRGTVPRRDLEALEAIAEACAHRLAHLLAQARAGTSSTQGVRTHAEPPDPAADHQPMLAAAVRAADAGVFERDLVTGESAWDAAAYRLVGRTPPDGPGPYPAPELTSLVHPEELPDVQAALVDVLARGGRYRLTYRALRPDGTVAEVDERGEVLLDVHGRPVRIAGLLTEHHHPGGSDGGPSTTTIGSGAGLPHTGPPHTGLSDAGLSDAGAGARSALLLALTSALSRAVGVRDVTAALTDVARPALGAAELVLDVVDEGRLLPVSPSVYGGPHRSEMHRLHQSEATAEQAPARSVPLFSEPGTATTAGGPAAWAVLPLVASGRQVGSCLITFATERAFSREDRTFYTAFAGVLAQSLERARLYDTHYQRATELQRAMLPRTLPRLPGLTSVARYLPGTEGMQIGGDWYDLIPLPSGRVGVVIGDVQGHNAEATAVMGQLRSGLRAYATDGHDPAATLARTSRLLAELDTDLFATCLYLTLNLGNGTIHGARAGHPAPVRIADGRAIELDLPGGPPLGVDPSISYPLTIEQLGLGETLLAYTDGLVEDRSEDYDESVQRMLGGLELWYRRAGPTRVGAYRALEQLADLLTLNVTERHSRPDDVALLLLHR
ncbi:SpoIIE family protein phosphatase [Kitasatospora sp. NPDC052896]|uniref:SpoIIE family protein phosphatase n=1 Tax=Kitasatospora sp. NPDC052896 TaxID=3364061 RepID=UPI0037C9A7D9